MRLFRSGTGEHPVTEMLRHMEHGRFEEAGLALARYRDGFLPPPHALWRLGRWLAQRGHTRQAKLALKLFADLYHAHGDRPQVLTDLAKVLRALGEKQQAAEVADEARRLLRAREQAPAGARG